MQRDREAQDNFNRSGSVFDSFRDFGSRGRMFPSLFERNDPFDDPFFARPIGSLFRSGTSDTNDPGDSQQKSRSKGPVIEEIDSDDDRFSEENQEGDNIHSAWANRNPLVEHPEDQAIGNGRSENKSQIQAYKKDDVNIKGTKSQKSGVSFQRVTYGGIDGAYYTAATTCRRGDGVIFEDSKQADKTTGQAVHRISRGIHDKGHSITRTLDSDGKVDTVQTLHNLEEDELAGFEQVWKGNGDKHFEDLLGFPGNIGVGDRRHGGLTSWGGFADPFRKHPSRNGGQSADYNFQSQSSQGRPKKVVRIHID